MRTLFWRHQAEFCRNSTYNEAPRKEIEPPLIFVCGNSIPQLHLVYSSTVNISQCSHIYNVLSYHLWSLYGNLAFTTDLPLGHVNDDMILLIHLIVDIGQHIVT